MKKASIPHVAVIKAPSKGPEPSHVTQVLCAKSSSSKPESDPEPKATNRVFSIWQEKPRLKGLFRDGGHFDPDFRQGRRFKNPPEAGGLRTRALFTPLLLND